ncbi:MAG: ATP-binding protein [Rhodospirillaceae bacterium]
MASAPIPHLAPSAIRATHVLAIVSPAPDLLQFAREALWAAQERDLPLTIAIRAVPRLRAELLGLDTIDDLTVFAERWGVTLVPWRTNEDLEAMIGGWAVRPPAAIVLGARRARTDLHGLPGPFATRIEQAARAVGIDVMPDPSHEGGGAPRLGLAWRVDDQRPWYHDYVLSAFAVSLVAVLVQVLDRMVAAPGGLVILFLTAVVYSASAYGLAAASFTSLLSLLIFNYFFKQPRYELGLSAPGDILVFILFIVVAAITSNLSGRLRQQANRAQRQAREARALFQLTRDIAVAQDTQEIFCAIVHQCNDIFECDTTLLTPFTGGGRETLALASSRARAAALQAAYPPHANLTQEEIEAARWVFNEGSPAGRGTSMWPEMQATFQPLETGEGTVAVLVLRDTAREIVRSAGFRRVIGSICRLTALAVEHSLRKQELENARVVSQTEGLRSALLSSISHDFGTPLASIIGSASSLISYGRSYGPEVTSELLTTILEEAERLNRFVKNVLQMNRLEAGALTPRLQWADVGDLISTALDAVHRRVAQHEVYADVEDMLPLVNVDFVLMESVLVNLLDNAAKYSPPETAIQITARRLGDDVGIDVTDQGRGISSEELGAIFDKFYRARQRDRTVPGTGLGLAICKGIIDAHGGTIEALSEGLGHGTTIRLRLPVKTPDVAVTAEV